MSTARFCCIVCGTVACILVFGTMQLHAAGDNVALSRFAAAATKSETGKQEDGQKTVETRKQEKIAGKSVAPKNNKVAGISKEGKAEGKKSPARRKAVQAAIMSAKKDGNVRVSKRKSKERIRAHPLASPLPQSGTASWVGRSFHGKPVAAGRGENYDLESFTAAHLSAPFDSILKVTEISSGRSVYVRVNDRGPYVRGRIIDLSLGAAQHLGYASKGLTTVHVEIAGSDSDPDLRYYIRLQTEKSAVAAPPVEGFGPFDRFDDAVTLLADLHKSYPQAQLVLMKEKS